LALFYLLPWLVNSRRPVARSPDQPSGGSNVPSRLSGSGSFSYPSRSGKKDLDYNINASIKYNVVSSLDKVGKNDHVMIIAEKLVNSKSGDVLGWGNNPGQISAVESGTVGKSGTGGFNEVASHELGHNLGLDHTNGGLMNASSEGSTSLTDVQKGSIVSHLGMGAEAKDGTYLQSITTPSRYQKDAKTQAHEFIKTNVIR
jgi:Metallo-peptidase family M12B Reprolysin-like